MVRMSLNEDIFDGLPTNNAIADAIFVDEEDTLEGKAREQSGSEATVMKIDNFRNECVRETEDNLNRRLLQTMRRPTRDVLEKIRFLCVPLY